MERKPAPPPYDSLRGVHLFHAAMSNCSQRVRMALIENDVSWESHLVNLAANEHLRPEYQALHPGGVVPALVHDGIVVLESIQIIAYVTTVLGGDTDGNLLRFTESEREAALLQLADAIQLPLKLLSYTYLFGDRLRKSPEEMEEYARLQGNSSLVAWQARFSARDFSDEEVTEAAHAMSDAFLSLEQALAESAYLSGSEFGLADIAWAANARRAELLVTKQPDLLSFESCQNVQQWYGRVRQRRSFSEALTAFEPARVPAGSVMSPREIRS